MKSFIFSGLLLVGVIMGVTLAGQGHGETHNFSVGRGSIQLLLLPETAQDQEDGQRDGGFDGAIFIDGEEYAIEGTPVQLDDQGGSLKGEATAKLTPKAEPPPDKVGRPTELRVEFDFDPEDSDNDDPGDRGGSALPVGGSFRWTLFH